MLTAPVLQLLPHCLRPGTRLRNSGLFSGVAGKTKPTYRAKSGVIPLEPKIVGEALTGVQAVVTVGILHLWHQAREKPIIPLPVGEGASTHHAHARTHAPGGLRRQLDSPKSQKRLGVGAPPSA